MKKNYFVCLSFFAFMLLASAQNSIAQCNTGDDYTTYIPSCNGTPEAYAGCTWAGEYNTLSLTGSLMYTLGSSITTDFITVTDASNVVLTSGTQPINFIPTSTADYRVYIHEDPTCGTATTCRSPWNMFRINQYSCCKGIYFCRHCC